MLIKPKQIRMRYSEEEKYQFFVEGKIRVPSYHKNKKKYNRSKLRQNRIKFDYENY